MIAADTSAWIDYSSGSETAAARRLELCLENGNLVMPPHVLMEILSAPTLSKDVAEWILRLPRLDVVDGYWERAGSLRRKLLVKGRKARSMDCLIAQSCIDHGVGLIATDRDFKHFTSFGLRLA